MIKNALIPVLILLSGCLGAAPQVEVPEFNNTAKNTLMQTMLAQVGILDAVIDITDQRVLVRYELPEEMSDIATWFGIAGAAAAVSPGSGKIVIQQYSNFTFVKEIEINMQDALDLIQEKITIEEFMERNNIPFVS